MPRANRINGWVPTVQPLRLHKTNPVPNVPRVPIDPDVFEAKKRAIWLSSKIYSKLVVDGFIAKPFRMPADVALKSKPKN
jgi:hypothetical protein